jgi:hypothetical protein
MPSAPGANAVEDPKQNLLNFSLDQIAHYTREGGYAANASKDFHLFFVGRDDVHSILVHLISRARESLYLNMFGYDDDELNDVIMKKALDPSIKVVITLDKSQAGGVHEKALLDADRAAALAAFNSHFVIGQSATHQISHTKGFVVDGRVGAEGSTNWSSSGEGVWTQTTGPGGTGFKAQNNTQTVFTDPDSVQRFQQELINEHLLARDDASVAHDSDTPPPRQRRLTIDQLHQTRRNAPEHPTLTAMDAAQAPHGAAAIALDH